MFAKTFRVNFRFFHDRFHLFRFFFDFQKFLARFLFADIVKNVSTSINLLIESRQMFQKLKTMKYS